MPTLRRIQIEKSMIPAELGMSDWYPIANPPDDCEPVLFYEPGEICRHDGIIISGYMHGDVPCDDNGRKVNATHWHRLPAAPLSGSPQEPK